MHVAQKSNNNNNNNISSNSNNDNNNNKVDNYSAVCQLTMSINNNTPTQRGRNNSLTPCLPWELITN